VSLLTIRVNVTAQWLEEADESDDDDE